MRGFHGRGQFFEGADQKFVREALAVLVGKIHHTDDGLIGLRSVHPKATFERGTIAVVAVAFRVSQDHFFGGANAPASTSTENSVDRRGGLRVTGAYDPRGRGIRRTLRVHDHIGVDEVVEARHSVFRAGDIGGARAIVELPPDGLEAREQKTVLLFGDPRVGAARVFFRRFFVGLVGSVKDVSVDLHHRVPGLGDGGAFVDLPPTDFGKIGSDGLEIHRAVDGLEGEFGQFGGGGGGTLHQSRDGRAMGAAGDVEKGWHGGHKGFSVGDRGEGADGANAR